MDKEFRMILTTRSGSKAVSSDAIGVFCYLLVSRYIINPSFFFSIKYFTVFRNAALQHAIGVGIQSN
ncbi:hypothetical protein AT959_14470 [Dechloromonas denitrificans]|uniref:Uncharacterized protein n=1 Tax=Dechloromonas denitrificans TaxID=281362 RepID=A0A133XHX9_9RHOO|nr:hypothetical protein AT959_14470 [Dechloromonas denitrificans]